MRKNSYIRGLTESQTLAYVLRCIYEGKNEEQIAERFDGDTVLVKTWIDALKQIHYVVTNQFNELVITSDGKNYLQKSDSDR
ncbi:MAG TPA: hypothetical protein VHJ38_16235 [Nitrososphaeraceae archaeon]|jgi:hypothetical protein|nr:hypothetical protein [Nitrososphaeraceae archaeon]